MYFAILIPLGGGGGGAPDQGLPGAPPGYWGGVAPPIASHPIAPGGPPPGIWPSPPSPGHPSHPIFTPPGFWGGVAPPVASHPIAPGGAPPGIWPSPGHPSHPIFLPPTQPPPPTEVWPPLPPDKPQPIEGYYLAYVPGLGKWVYIPVDSTKPVPPAEPKG
jgi:hypothetical protein